jgi:hypothetical protein
MALKMTKTERTRPGRGVITHLAEACVSVCLLSGV